MSLVISYMVYHSKMKKFMIFVTISRLKPLMEKKGLVAMQGNFISIPLSTPRYLYGIGQNTMNHIRQKLKSGYIN